MRGTIVQVSVSRGGIPKTAIAEGRLGPLGIEGDLCAHPKIHGGPRQAVLLIAAEAIAQLRSQGFDVTPGALGENLTTNGLDPHAWRVGQRFEVGEALLELTKLRAPCLTLNVFNSGDRSIQTFVYDKQVKAGDVSSPLWGLGGVYAAVLRPGMVRANDTITLVDPVV